jgi:hypothetical protein
LKFSYPKLRSLKVLAQSVLRTVRSLVASIARGRRWLAELIANPAATTESIAKREAQARTRNPNNARSCDRAENPASGAANGTVSCG